MSVDPFFDNTTTNNTSFTTTFPIPSSNTLSVRIPIEISPNIRVRTKNGKPVIQFNKAGLKEGQYYEVKWKKRKWLLQKKGKYIDLYEFTSKTIPKAPRKKKQ